MLFLVPLLIIVSIPAKAIRFERPVSRIEKNQLHYDSYLKNNEELFCYAFLTNNIFYDLLKNNLKYNQNQETIIKTLDDMSYRKACLLNVLKLLDESNSEKSKHCGDFHLHVTAPLETVSKVTITLKTGEIPLLHQILIHNKIQTALYLISLATQHNHSFDKDGNTPLHIATSLELSDVVHALLTTNAPLVPNKKRITPVHLAAMLGIPSIMKLLLPRTQHVQQKDLQGKTPLDYAVQNYASDPQSKNNFEILTLLLERLIQIRQSSPTL